MIPPFMFPMIRPGLYALADDAAHERQGDCHAARPGPVADHAIDVRRRRREALMRPFAFLSLLRKLSKMRKSGEVGQGTVRRA